MDHPALRLLEPAKTKFVAVILLTSAIVLVVGLAATRQLIWEHYQQYAIKKGWIPCPQIERASTNDDDEVVPPESDSLDDGSDYEVSQAIETRQVNRAWGRDKRYVTLTRRQTKKEN